MKDFKITDSMGFGYEENLGVFFYNSRVYSPEDNNDGVKSYKFKLNLLSSNITLDQRLKKEKLEYEPIEFIATIDLKEYVLISEMSEEMFKRFKYDSKEIRRLDYKKITEEFYPELNEVKERLERKINNVKKEQKIVSCYKEEVEFLYFNDTAENWGGPYKYSFDNKEYKGCVLSPNIEDHKNEFFMRIDNEKNDFINKVRSYLFPQEKRPDYSFNDKSNKEKREYLNTLDTKTLIQIYKETMNKDDEEMSLNFYEYNIHLSGNDDCSYTKGFHTEKEVIEELEYLRMMQPLDMYRDIYDRDYVFTN